jgi:two-component system nitrogen regulation sensor histidine kinase NtrY
MISVFVILLPSLFFAILAYAYHAYGIESLFNEKVSKALSQSVEIAESYLKEHKENIRADILEIANDIYRNREALDEDPSLYRPFLDKQASLRNLSEIMIFERDRVVAQNTFSFSLAFEKFPEQQLLDAEKGDVIIISNADDKVRALLKLRDEANTYLLIGRFVDRDIIEHLKVTQGSADYFNDMMRDVKNTKFKLEMSFLISVVVLCVLAIVLGVRFAKYITKPLNRLVDATEKVKSGDFSIRLPEKKGRDETATLTRAFNQMTETLSVQRNQLSKFTQLIDERRRFIEAVLAEVTAGVIVVTPGQDISLYNSSAAKLLNISKRKKDVKLKDIFPEIVGMINSATETPDQIIQNNIEIGREGERYTFFVRVGVQIIGDDEIDSYIVTFDDITDLVNAQRSAAWADVARRIAHEIKNPLTPINLSAERLKKKYIDEIKSDKQSFEKYVDTIIRHVGDIGKIVEEFVEFARIPLPKMAKVDLVQIIKDSIFSQEFVYKFIKYNFDYKGKNCYVMCDTTQITQVLTNLLKNAAESIETKLLNSEKKFEGKVNVTLKKVDDKFVEVKIEDNGMGFDQDIINRVTEPYVTSKLKGTGLGLPIVKKIVEDHGGTLTVANTTKGAAISFKLLLGGKG